MRWQTSGDKCLFDHRGRANISTIRLFWPLPFHIESRTGKRSVQGAHRLVAQFVTNRGTYPEHAEPGGVTVLVLGREIGGVVLVLVQDP